MKTILKTQRLYLRKFLPCDAEGLYNLNLDTDVIKYTGDSKFSSLEDAQTFIASYHEYEKNGYGRWSVVRKDSGEFIGWCGLKLNEENMIDLGFRIFKKDWNKGFATEAAAACIEYGFEVLKLNTIIGRSLKKNIASIKVLEKIGMKHWKDTVCHETEECVYYKIEK